MKKLVSLLVIIVLVQLVFAAEMTLEVGQIQEFEGYDLKLKNLKSDKAVISVNDESAIFEVEDEKTILGVNIELNEIIYIGESEGSVKVGVSALYVCGDDSCNGEETKETCCEDCGCEGGYDCVDGECLVHVDHECENDSDCDDGNGDTLDQCSNDWPRVCRHISTLICDEASDCDDSDPCTTDRCTNNDCFNEQIPNCVSGGEGDSVDVEIEEEETEEVAQEPSLEPEGKVSVFQKIINWFKGLFSREG